jgi:hypothetical protein
LEELAKQIQGLMQKLEELRTVKSEARRAEIEALKARIKRAKRKARLLEEEKEKQIKPEDVVPHPLDYLTDLTRAYAGKTLSTAALEKLCKAERITEYVDENNDLLANPKKMAALRNMLLQ